MLRLFLVILTHENKLISPLLLDGPVVYAAYLKMEHSDENIQFWMACETYKKIASRWSRISRAKKLYKIYIQPQSPREVTTSQWQEWKSVHPCKSTNMDISIHKCQALYIQCLLKCYKFSIANLILQIRNLRLWELVQCHTAVKSGKVKIQN